MCFGEEATGYPTTALGALIVALLLMLSAGAWLLRHVFSVMIPSLSATFMAALKEQGVEHKAALELLISHHEKQCSRRDAMQAAESKAIVETLQELSEGYEAQGKALAEMSRVLSARRRPPIPPPGTAGGTT